MIQVLVTGVAGFIGFHVAKRFLNEGCQVVGIDNLNNYYDVKLKKARLEQLQITDRFSFIKIDLKDRKGIEDVITANEYDYIIHLAAQAGVRYSIENPYSYVDSNLVGFLNILEGCRKIRIKNLVFASSSSVYGANTRKPLSVHHNVDHPLSLYAATKKANELMAHSYSSLFKIPTVGLRFFTVYGPWGRPDMALFKFAKRIIEGKPIDVYNYGNMKRDFTYIDDIVEGIFRITYNIPKSNPSWDSYNPDPGTSFAPYKIYNIGNNKPVDLITFISIIEEEIGKKAEINYLPLQPGDVIETFSDITELAIDVKFRPNTSIKEGIKKFIKWYRGYYAV